MTMTELTRPGAWDEPSAATPRGTLVVLPGRGESAASYERFGRRLSADAYRVRWVPVDLDDLDAARAAVEALLADETLPSPKVLVGTDTGATLAATLADELPVDAVVVAGLALPDSTPPGTWEQELEARTACPVHRTVLGEDDVFDRGALDQELPAAWRDLRLTAPDKPALVLHGTADVVTPADAAVVPYLHAPSARVSLVDGGRHDVLNDVSHRSVAATIVLFLESLRLGADLPVVVRSAGAGPR